MILWELSERLRLREALTAVYRVEVVGAEQVPARVHPEHQLEGSGLLCGEPREHRSRALAGPRVQRRGDDVRAYGLVVLHRTHCLIASLPRA